MYLKILHIYCHILLIWNIQTINNYLVGKTLDIIILSLWITDLLLSFSGLNTKIACGKKKIEYRFSLGPAKLSFRILMLMAHEERVIWLNPRARLDLFRCIVKLHLMLFYVIRCVIIFSFLFGILQYVYIYCAILWLKNDKKIRLAIFRKHIHIIINIMIQFIWKFDSTINYSRNSVLYLIRKIFPLSLHDSVWHTYKSTIL